MNRRKFIKNGIIAGGISGIGLGVYANQVEPFWLEIVHKKMPINFLPKELEGATLMQISDIHVGDRFDYHFIIDSFVKAQKLLPEFVVYTGDFISYKQGYNYDELKEVMQSTVKGRMGTFGILGNHDYGINWAEQSVADNVSEILTDGGIELLENSGLQSNGLNFIGLDDYYGPNFDPKLVMSQHDGQQANIVLCHNPDVCDLNVWSDYKGWILAGHTHGGQCKPPFLNPPVLPIKNKKYISGEVDLEDGRTLYVNRALGHLWQVRFNVRPEITMFTLEKA